MTSRIDGKRVLVTGACGTVGTEVVRQLLERFAPGEVLAMDNNESALFYQMEQYAARDDFMPFLGDVRDRDKLERRFAGVDVVIHAAAFKHVILCEKSPFEAVQTNILGVQNVIEAARAARVSRVMFTSSDKAVNPTNVMGTSKLMGERLMTAANTLDVGRSIFFSTRFGNVLGSRGSVLPIFVSQIRSGKPITLTHEDMTRFVMTIEQAVDLVLETVDMARGGEVFITKMPVMCIKDLARAVIEEFAPRFGHDPETYPIRVMGVKPGEKLYEELMTHEEIRRAYELDKYFAVLPAFKDAYPQITYEYDGLLSTEVRQAYDSSHSRCMSVEEIRSYLTVNRLLEQAVCGLEF